jgi:hypothetical protein
MYACLSTYRVYRVYIVTWRLKAGITTKRSGSPYARQRFGKHIYRVTQSTVGALLLSSSQSSRGVQQTATTDIRSEILKGGDSCTVMPEVVKGEEFARQSSDWVVDTKSSWKGHVRIRPGVISQPQELINYPATVDGKTRVGKVKLSL